MRFNPKYLTIFLTLIILMMSGPRICLSSQCPSVKIDRHACCHASNLNRASIKATCCEQNQLQQEGTLSAFKSIENSEKIPLAFTWDTAFITQPKIRTAGLSAFKNTGPSWGQVFSPILRI